MKKVKLQFKSWKGTSRMEQQFDLSFAKHIIGNDKSWEDTSEMEQQFNFKFAKHIGKSWEGTSGMDEGPQFHFAYISPLWETCRIDYKESDKRNLNRSESSSNHCIFFCSFSLHFPFSLLSDLPFPDSVERNFTVDQHLCWTNRNFMKTACALVTAVNDKSVLVGRHSGKVSINI